MRHKRANKTKHPEFPPGDPRRYGPGPGSIRQRLGKLYFFSIGLHWPRFSLNVYHRPAMPRRRGA